MLIRRGAGCALLGSSGCDQQQYQSQIEKKSLHVSLLRLDRRVGTLTHRERRARLHTIQMRAKKGSLLPKQNRIQLWTELRSSQLLCCSFHYHCGAVREHLGNALHHFGGVIARSDHSIRAEFTSVLQHQVECLSASFLAEVCEQSDIAANEALQPRTDASYNGTRTHYDAAYDSQSAHYPVTRKFEAGGDHLMSGSA